MSAAKRKVNPLTLQEKRAVILEVERSNGRTKSQIAEQFRIPKSTLSTILKEKERILNLNDSLEDFGSQRKRMRMRRGTYPQIEEALFAWLQQQAAANQTITSQRMLAYSQQLARQLGVDDFKCSAGWLDSFKRRHGLSMGRPGSADLPAGDFLSQLPALLEEYSAGDVFVVSEMGLVFDLTPSEAVAAIDSCAAGQQPRRRLSVLAATNADGSQKLPLFICGPENLPGASEPGRLTYRCDSASWLQPADFANWLEKRNGEFAAQGRRALFLCESGPLHAVAGGGQDSLQVVRLPPSPLTQAQLSSPDGMLHQLKRHFRGRVAGWLREHGRPPTVGEAVAMLSRAWSGGVSAAHVRRFHAAAGLLRHDAANGTDDAADDAAAAYKALAGAAFEPPAGASFSGYVTADDGVWWCREGPSDPAGSQVVAATSVRADRLTAPLVPAARAGDRRVSPPIKRERSPAPKREGHGSPAPPSAAARRRPSSQEALKAIVVLQQYFQLRDRDEELDEVLSFVAFTKEKIIKLQQQETNGVVKPKKEAKPEKTDSLDCVKFESPILSIDPDVDPQDEAPQTSPSDATAAPLKAGNELLTARKGRIRVGPQFQALVPPAPLESLEPPPEPTPAPEEHRWSTRHELQEHQVNQFVLLTRAVGMLARACDTTAVGSGTTQALHVAAANASRDITRAHALDLLFRHDYQLSEALTSLLPSGGPVLCRDELEDWSSSETAIFEEAINKHGKAFDVIQRECLPWKTTRQICEYYYMWKTTGRYVRRRRAKHMARRLAASAAAATSPPALASPSPPAAPASAAPPPAAAGGGGGGRQAADALTLLSPMLNALGTSVSIEPVAAAARRSPERRNQNGAEKLYAGVRLSGECSITPVPLGR